MPATPNSILDLPAISGCYLFPQKRRLQDPLVVRVGQIELACFHHVVNTDGLTLVHFHGNGEAVADYVPGMVDQLAELGLNSLFVEYRAYGGSTGSAQLAAMLGDGQAAIRAAGLDAGRVIAFGRSLGSLYAIELVRREPNLAGLILESGIADAAERFLAYADLSTTGIDEAEVMAEVRRHFDHQAKLSGYRGPLLILHTEHDGLIDIAHAERNLAWSAASQKRLVRFAQGDHNSILAWNHEEYFQALRGFVESIV